MSKRQRERTKHMAHHSVPAWKEISSTLPRCVCVSLLEVVFDVHRVLGSSRPSQHS